MPRNYKEAIKVDQENSNTLWQDAVKRKIGQIIDFKTFKLLAKGCKPSAGHTFVPVHLCFDVRFNLMCKACLVAGGNWTDPPDSDIYSGMVSIDSIKTAFLVAKLNDLKVMAADVGNAYMHGYTKEKIYTVAGSEFCDLEGRILICVKSLYGLKTSMGRWHEALSETLLLEQLTVL